MFKPRVVFTATLQQQQQYREPLQRYSSRVYCCSRHISVHECFRNPPKPHSRLECMYSSTHHSALAKCKLIHTHIPDISSEPPAALVIPPLYISALLLLIYTKTLRYSIDYHTINNHQARTIASFLSTPPQHPRLLSSATPNRLVTGRRQLWACGSTPGVGTRRLRTTGWLTFWSTWLSRGPENAPRRGSRRR